MAEVAEHGRLLAGRALDLFCGGAQSFLIRVTHSRDYRILAAQHRVQKCPASPAGPYEPDSDRVIRRHSLCDTPRTISFSRRHRTGQRTSDEMTTIHSRHGGP